MTLTHTPRIKHNQKLKRFNRSGFMLIELLIAIAIVAIMVAVVGPNMLKYLENARKSSAQTTVRMLEGALTMFQANTGQFPSSLRDLVKKPRDERVAKKWEGPYLKQKEIPQDPWGNKYQYRITPQSENPYELYSFGPKGKGTPKNEWINVWDES